MQIVESRKTTVLENGMIWFGAGVSIAEILTGTYFASLGFQKGIIAIVTGHIIGCIMMFLAGLIGARTEKSAMETVKLSFGNQGGKLFAILNVLQLMGWTGIMIYDGGLSADGMLGISAKIWCVVIGLLVMAWIAFGVTRLDKLNFAAMALLFILTVVLCVVIFGHSSQSGVMVDDSMSFGAAVELAVAMPLSWLPVISDYTREAEKPVRATAVSVVTYGLVSCWMYVIGMGAAILTGESDIASIMVKAGLGAAGLLIIVFSTVTTTFLDAFSAGVSAESVFGGLKGKYMGIAAAVIGTVAAVIFPMDDITDFLYLIGSVFAPMIAIQITDQFILGGRQTKSDFDWPALIVWVIGFAAYRYLMGVDLPLGNTLPDMVITVIICLIVRKIVPEKK